MPKTKFQSFLFSLIMVFCMVFCMTVYTLALQTGSLQYQTFAVAIREMWVEYVLVFLLIFFVISHVAKKLAFRIVNPETDRPIFIILAIQSFTVVCIVPTITLLATFLHHGITGDWFVQWITTAAQCFPVAYLLQIFFVGPFVRWIFQCIVQSRLYSAICNLTLRKKETE